MLDILSIQLSVPVHEKLDQSVCEVQDSLPQ